MKMNNPKYIDVQEIIFKYPKGIRLGISGESAQQFAAFFFKSKEAEKYNWKVVGLKDKTEKQKMSSLKKLVSYLSGQEKK